MGPAEEEFDPTKYAPEYITVEAAEGIQSILDKVANAWTRTPNAVLVIPRGAQAFHTTHDFLALGKIQGAREVRVSVASLDPSIAALARVLGFHMVDPPEGHPALLGDPALGSTALTGDIEKPTAPLSIGSAEGLPDWVLSPALPIYTSPGLTTSTWLNNPGDPAPLAGAQRPWTPPQASRSGMPSPRTRPRQTGQLSPALITGAHLTGSLPTNPPEVSPTPSGRIKARQAVVLGGAYQNARGLRYGGLSKPVRWGRLFVIVATVIALSLVAGSAYAYVYLPEGTIYVTPLSKTISALPVEISVITSGDGSQAGAPTISNPGSGPQGAVSAPSLAATLLHVPIIEEGTRPATGTKQVPHGKATGTMHFTNRTGGPISVPPGTSFKASNGVTVQTTTGGTVPATVFGQSFGTLDLPIVAGVPGPDGNIGPNQISGVYGGTLNYTNSALQGGAVDTVKVVTQADIDGLKAELQARASDKVGGAIFALVTPGEQLITQTVSLPPLSFEADHKAGEDADAVHIKLTGEAQGYAYSEDKLRDSVAQAVLDSMHDTVNPAFGPNLDTASIQYDPPVVQSVEQGRVLYGTSASARVTFSLTPDLAGRIRDLVKGKEITQARTLLTQAYGSYVNPSTIQAKVLWFNIDKLPNDPARIEVQASATQSVRPVPVPPSSQSTPDPRSVQP